MRKETKHSMCQTMRLKTYIILYWYWHNAGSTEANPAGHSLECVYVCISHPLSCSSPWKNWTIPTWDVTMAAISSHLYSACKTQILPLLERLLYRQCLKWGTRQEHGVRLKKITFLILKIHMKKPQATTETALILQQNDSYRIVSHTPSYPLPRNCMCYSTN